MGIRLIPGQLSNSMGQVPRAPAPTCSACTPIRIRVPFRTDSYKRPVFWETNSKRSPSQTLHPSQHVTFCSEVCPGFQFSSPSGPTVACSGPSGMHLHSSQRAHGGAACSAMCPLGEGPFRREMWAVGSVTIGTLLKE